MPLRDVFDQIGERAFIRHVQRECLNYPELGHFLARSFTWQLPGLAAARGLGLAALQAAAPLKSRLARQMMFGSR